ncbi:MAG: hypothetical protein H7Y27_08190 [Gemmatimonadaceae bacterium]|nr:hypothetical protein [Chitinophagaceae bacterium]
MQDLSYTIAGNYFYHTSLSREQRISGMRWDRPTSRGRVVSGSLSQSASYSITEVNTSQDFSAKYLGGDKLGYLVIVEQLDGSDFIQFKTENEFSTDFAPRPFEIYVIPATEKLTVKYAPNSRVKRLEIFMDTREMEELCLFGLIEQIKGRNGLRFSNDLSSSGYEQLSEMGTNFFRNAFQSTDKQRKSSISEMLQMFNNFSLA